MTVRYQGYSCLEVNRVFLVVHAGSTLSSSKHKQRLVLQLLTTMSLLQSWQHGLHCMCAESGYWSLCMSSAVLF